MPPEFSIIVPTYGRPQFLAAALESVLAQTVADYECLVIDDASPEPQTLPADPRFRLVRRERNGGPPAARNTGIGEATGKYVAFLDDDDVWVPGRLQMAVDAHARAPIAICWQGTLGEEVAPPTGRLLDGDVSDTVLDGIIPHLGATSIERAITPNFDERYEASDDVEWWLRIAQRWPVATTPKVGLLYRVHDTPRTRTGQRTRLLNGEMLLDEYAGWFRAHPRAKAFRLKRMGLSALRVHERGLALRYFARSLRAQPEARTAWHALRCFAPTRGTAGG